MRCGKYCSEWMFVVTRMNLKSTTYGVHHRAIFDCYVLRWFGQLLLLRWLIVEVVLFERPAATGKAHLVGAKCLS